MIGGRRVKCCKRWWSANPITLSQIWLPPPPVPPALVHHQSFQGDYMSISPCTHVHTRTYTYECVPPTRLTRPCRTTTVSKIEFATSEVCLHHWFPPSFENGIVHEYPSNRRPLNENWPKGERASFERFFARSTINYASAARIGVNFGKNRRIGEFRWKNFVVFTRRGWIFYLSINFSIRLFRSILFLIDLWQFMTRFHCFLSINIRAQSYSVFFFNNSSTHAKSSVSFLSCPLRIMPRRREMFVFIQKKSKLNSLTRLFALPRYIPSSMYFFPFPLFPSLSGVGWNIQVEKEDETRCVSCYAASLHYSRPLNFSCFLLFKKRHFRSEIVAVNFEMAYL